MSWPPLLGSDIPSSKYGDHGPPVFNIGARSAQGQSAAGSFGNMIHGHRQIEVETGQSAGIVGGQPHLDGPVDIFPFGVMIEFFGDQRRARS
jgi:hypothetical protein